MRRTYRLISYLYPIVLALTSGAGVLILIKNLKAGTYDVSQDSIGLPIGVTLMVFLILALTHLLQILLLRWACANSFAALLLKISAYLIATVSLLILVDRIVYWSIPNHAVIAILYGVTAITFVVFQMQTIAQLK
ncbi:hypothetical protein KKQ10_07220 [Pseudomonas sp. MG-9]|uniref:Integral membrane protein n=1 Tax=Pseudomonas serboccidentalis TaxID=2964670 RepID=A0ABY7ZDL5_9PSED|nr:MULTISPECIES: hypothetical protein [Pseudomonas]MBT9264660.1 hypothetical protein [Pseudomonas sp. MG-9]WDR37067.1 hypothetical protein NN484_04870 [Pseudomonas serboccidentalis]